MGLIELGHRILRHAWRVPLLGQLLAADYARSFERFPANRFRGVLPSFAAAEASIPAGGRVGYDHAEMAGLYRLRMEKACQSDYAVLFWLRRILDTRPASFVFDFGGHVGVWRRGLAAHGGRPCRWARRPGSRTDSGLARQTRTSPGASTSSTLRDLPRCVWLGLEPPP